jgi:hypothetical protein
MVISQYQGRHTRLRVRSAGRGLKAKRFPNETVPADERKCESIRANTTDTTNTSRYECVRYECDTTDPSAIRPIRADAGEPVRVRRARESDYYELIQIDTSVKAITSKYELDARKNERANAFPRGSCAETQLF